MPKEGTAKAPNRWEGTQTYPRNNPTRRRTVAQVQEDVAARLKIDREKRRVGVEKLRRNSIATIPVPLPVNETASADDTGIEEVFFDATGEEMPGSSKKKRQASGAATVNCDSDMPNPDPDPKAPVQPGVDPAMLALLMSIKKDINDTTKSAVDKIDRRIDENAKAIQKVGEDTTLEMRKLRQHCEESQARFEEKVEKKLEMREQKIERRLLTLEVKTLAPAGRVAMRTEKQEEAYHLARRTLKLWPIRGEDLEDATAVFLNNKLKISDDRIRAFGKITVRTSLGKAARDRAEVLATFECREDRDYIKSMGTHLAGQDAVGMSIHVPGHLLDNFYALNSIGFNIKKNQDGVKRSIKFDDAIQDIYLDIFIGGQWKKILPGQAKSALKSTPVAGAPSAAGISAEDLVSLVQGEQVPGLTAVVVPMSDDGDSGGAGGNPTRGN